LFGRLESGESACVIVTRPVFTISMAAAAAWDSSRLQYDLTEHLKNWNGQMTEQDIKQQQLGRQIPWKRARCTRTLCVCKSCRKCLARKCVCRCVRCNADPCECKQFSLSEINHDVCASKRRRDRATVLGVENFSAVGYEGFESTPRRFVRMRLSRACYAAPAKDFLQSIDTGLPPAQAGVFGYNGSAVCSFMQAKRAAGFIWLDVADPRPVARQRSRCRHEFTAPWDSVSRSDEQPAPPPLVHLCLDIETLAQAQFSDIDPIGMIALRCGQAVVLVVGGAVVSKWVDTTEWKVHRYPTERDLLQATLRFIRDADPDIISGYNHLKFDLPRIVTRCAICSVPCDFSRLVGMETRVVKLMNTNKQSGARSVMFIDVPGRALLDVHVQVKKSQKLRDYSLKAVAEEFKIGVKKGDVEYGEIWSLFHGSPEDRARLVEYCAMDVDVCMAIEKRLGLINEAVGYSSKCYLLPRHFLTGTPSFFGRQLLSAYIGNFQVQMLPWGTPTCEFLKQSPSLMALIKKGTFVGGLVQEPICGLHKHYVIVIDFSGLYTSIIMANNVSRDTFVGDEAMIRARGMDPKDLIEMPNHYYVVKHATRKGVLVTMLETLADQRRQAKKLRDSFPVGSDEYGMHHASQDSLKLAGNSQYGQLGAPGGNPALAEAVTMYGRGYITAVRAWIEKNYPEPDFTIIYGDTDSLMVSANAINERTLEALDKVRAIGHDMVDRLNKSGIYPKPMKLEFEKVTRMLLQAMKRYVGVMYTTDRGDFSCKPLAQGNEVKRRDNPACLPDMLKGLLKLLIEDCASIEEVIEYTRGVFYKIVRGLIPVEQLIMSQSITKPIAGYTGKNGEDPTESHVVAAKQLIAAGYPVDPGDRINMVFIENPSKRACDKVLAYKLYTDQRLDLDYYFDKFRGPFERVLEHVLTKQQLDNVFTKSVYMPNYQPVTNFVQTQTAAAGPTAAQSRPAKRRKSKAQTNVISAWVTDHVVEEVPVRVPTAAVPKRKYKQCDLSRWLS
jgi:DNA polymerase elongation subunit (family B)